MLKPAVGVRFAARISRGCHWTPNQRGGKGAQRPAFFCPKPEVNFAVTAGSAFRPGLAPHWPCSLAAPFDEACAVGGWAACKRSYYAQPRVARPKHRVPRKFLMYPRKLMRATHGRSRHCRQHTHHRAIHPALYSIRCIEGVLHACSPRSTSAVVCHQGLSHRKSCTARSILLLHGKWPSAPWPLSQTLHPRRSTVWPSAPCKS